MGLRVGEGKMEKREWTKKEDVTTPVKDISCHGTLLFPSPPAPFLQSFSAFFTHHCLSFSLFSHPYAHPLHLPPPFFFSLLPQLIISQSLLINRINVFSDALCPCSPLLLYIFLDCAGLFLPRPGLWSESVRQLHHFHSL